MRMKVRDMLIAYREAHTKFIDSAIHGKSSVKSFEALAALTKAAIHSDAEVEIPDADMETVRLFSGILSFRTIATTYGFRKTSHERSFLFAKLLKIK